MFFVFTVERTTRLFFVIQSFSLEQLVMIVTNTEIKDDKTPLSVEITRSLILRRVSYPFTHFHILPHIQDYIFCNYAVGIGTPDIQIYIFYVMASGGLYFSYLHHNSQSLLNI